MGDGRVIYTADAVQHNFQFLVAWRCALYRKSLLSFESPDRHSLLVALAPLSHRSTLNTPKSLGVPTAKNPED
jgi:hypothetical protein